MLDRHHWKFAKEAQKELAVCYFNRNIDMWREWVGGVSLTDLASKYDVTGSRTQQIVTKFTKKILEAALGNTWPNADAPSWVSEALYGIWVETVVDPEDYSEVTRFYTDSNLDGRVVYKNYFYPGYLLSRGMGKRRVENIHSKELFSVFNKTPARRRGAQRTAF